MTEPSTACLPIGADLPPEQDGTPRYVCACHLIRARPVRGRSIARLVWSGGLVPLVGAGLIALDLLVLLRANQPGGKVIAALLLLLLVAGTTAGGRNGGHRGACAARTSAYWFLAFPAVLLGALSIF